VVKTNEQALIEAMKRNTDSQSYSNLTEYLELRISLHMTTLVGAEDIAEIKRLQGRVLELQHFLKGLTRKPVAVQQHTGAFN